MDYAYSATGLLVGLLIGATGVGGGAIMTPALIFIFGVPPAIAVGTDLIFAATTKLGATIAHARSGTVQWRTVGWLGLGSLPGAASALLWYPQTGGASGASDIFITALLGLALILTAIALLLKTRLVAQAWTPRDPITTRPFSSRAPTILLGAVMGFFVATTSVGAGALGVVVLTFLYPRIAASRIVGTDIAHATLLAALAGLVHAAFGNVDLTLAGQLLLGSLPGVYLGTVLCTRVSERALRTILACLLLAVGLRFVLAA